VFVTDPVLVREPLTLLSVQPVTVVLASTQVDSLGFVDVVATGAVIEVGSVGTVVDSGAGAVVAGTEATVVVDVVAAG